MGEFGGGRMSHRKHRKFYGTPGGQYKIRLAREINASTSEEIKMKKNKKGKFVTVKELFKK